VIGSIGGGWDVIHDRRGSNGWNAGFWRLSEIDARMTVMAELLFLRRRLA